MNGMSGWTAAAERADKAAAKAQADREAWEAASWETHLESPETLEYLAERESR